MNKSAINIIFLTALSLLAFAGNSVLCRFALDDHAIDAGSFTTIRLLSGMITLVLIVYFRKLNLKQFKPCLIKTSKGSWLSALMLFVYATAFSFAYISLDTGTGALILFGSVQISMILSHRFLGNHLHYTEWLGLLIAFAGFLYLVLPVLSSPSAMGFVLMTISGIAWAVYTLKGRSSSNPMADTCFNFVRTLPFVVLLLLATIQNSHITFNGVILACASGAIASGLGYALWYTALNKLSVSQAAVVQLLVPALAAVGGIVFVGEVFSLRLLLSSVVILGGIFLVVTGKRLIEIKAG